MKTESTIEIRGVVTPNAAIATRSQTIWWTSALKPDSRKSQRASA